MKRFNIRKNEVYCKVNKPETQHIPAIVCYYRCNPISGFFTMKENNIYISIILLKPNIVAT